MKNKTAKVRKNGISRRKLLRTGSAAAVLAGFGVMANKVAHAGALSPATMDDVQEEETVAKVLAFWLAATNGHDSLKLPLTAQAVEQATGLKSTRAGDDVDIAIRHINNNPNTYNGLKVEFKKLSKLLFNYAPGQCPRKLETLKKLADVKPNA